MGRIAVVLVLAGFFCPSLAQAADCFEDTIREVSESGEIIMMMSGGVYQVMAGDEIDSALWLPASDALVCSRNVRSSNGTALSYYEIINTDESGEKVGAMRLR